MTQQEENREIRTLKWQNKSLGKQLGKAGATIYALRNENAALREAVTFNPGDRARLYSEVREKSVRIRELEEKAAANETVEPYHGKSEESK